MGIMQKIKQSLGIGGLKVKLSTGPTIATGSRVIVGTIDLLSKSDQSMTRLTVQFTEHRTTGKEAEKKTQKFELGETVVATDVQVTANAPLHYDFELPFMLARSVTEKMQAKGGAVGMLGKLGAMAEHEKIRYTVSAHASVKGRMMAASHSVDVKVV